MDRCLASLRARGIIAEAVVLPDGEKYKSMVDARCLLAFCISYFLCSYVSRIESYQTTSEITGRYVEMLLSSIGTNFIARIHDICLPVNRRRFMNMLGTAQELIFTSIAHLH